MLLDETAFRFDGGRPSVDLTATLGKRWREPPVERIGTPADLARWFAAAGLTDARVAVSRRVLHDAHELRESLYRLMRGVVYDLAPAPADLALVNRWAATAPPATRLRADGHALRAVAVRPTAAAVLAGIARDAVDLLAGPQAARLRECAGTHCTLLYVDTSRAGNRRWCSMASCGSQDKMARYRRRTAG